MGKLDGTNRKDVMLFWGDCDVVCVCVKRWNLVRCAICFGLEVHHLIVWICVC